VASLCEFPSSQVSPIYQCVEEFVHSPLPTTFGFSKVRWCRRFAARHIPFLNGRRCLKCSEAIAATARTGCRRNYRRALKGVLPHNHTLPIGAFLKNQMFAPRSSSICGERLPPRSVAPKIGCYSNGLSEPIACLPRQLQRLVAFGRGSPLRRL
jgi:hypothetical protein